MSWMPQKYNLEIIVLSPVHVGSGEVADPMEYVCMNSEDSDVIGYFESGEMLKKLINKKLISYSDLESGNYHKIRKSVYDLFQKDETCDDLVYSWVEINNSQYFKDFEEAIKNPKSNKRLEIDRICYSRVESKYIIPGSSLKGVIRTAIMSKLAEIKQLPKGREYKDYNNIITGGIEEDSFKNLIVPDIFFTSRQVAVVKPMEIKQKKENEGKKEVPKNYAESLKKGAKSKTTITMTDKLALKGASVGNFESIKRVMNEYYIPEFIAEYEKFYSKREELSKINFLKEKIEKLTGEGWALVRVGHYSHAESMTLKTLRNIKGRRIGTNDNVFGTTRTLADGELPFGWIAIREIPDA